VRLDDWFLTADERGNPATRLYRRRPDATAWSTGNEVTALVHGRSYFPVLLAAIRRQRAGDVLFFSDWRGDPDERLDGEGTEIAQVLIEAVERGVIVTGLLWRSHWDRLQFSEEENRHLGEEVDAAGGEVLRDMRVRTGGSHHQKLVVLRHPGRPELDVAFVGGIDLCHSRNDDADHHGDPQPQSMNPAYGDTPPWHDVQVQIRGPAVGDVEATFRERWEDPTPLTRNPLLRIADALRREDTSPNDLPDQLPDPAPCGPHAVQVLRTYPSLRMGRYPFAPDGERSIARAYTKVLRRARGLVYLEDQYFWTPQVAEVFADALAGQPSLRMIAVLPHHPDQDGRLSHGPQVLARHRALEVLERAGAGRFAAYGVENHAGTPVYVHAKVCVVDDVWASVGSDNVNLRSWTHDSELSSAVLDETPDRRAPGCPDGPEGCASRFARDLRLRLVREHLDRAEDDDADLLDPAEVFAAFARSAERLAAWHDGGRRAERPPGRVRPYQSEEPKRLSRLWATPFYRTVYDPDGRPRALRRRGTF